MYTRILIKADNLSEGLQRSKVSIPKATFSVSKTLEQQTFSKRTPEDATFFTKRTRGH